MDISEIIAQEEKAFNASENVKLEGKKNKSEILLPFAMRIFDFLEIIQNDKNFLFTSTAHASDGDYSPLFSNTSLTLEYYRGSVTTDIQKHAGARVLTRSFYYGIYGSRYLHFGIGDDFKPYFAFTNDLSAKQEEKIFTTDEAIRTLTKFFLSKRKKS